MTCNLRLATCDLKMPKQATLADVAKKSKVSISTVSLVLRDKPGIPDATRRRVIAAANILGYAAKHRTAMLQLQPPANRLARLGLILKAERDEPLQANPFYSYVVAGIEEACRRNQINLMYATMLVDADNAPVEMPRLMEEAQIDGLLLVGVYVGETLNALLCAKEMPVVLVDAYAASNDYDAVLTDNARGMFQAVSYLVEQGHTQIGLVGTQPGAFPSFLQRRSAYARALAAHGIKQTYYADCGRELETIELATQSLLQKHPNVTALVAANDEVALAAMASAQAMGRRIPQDLSIVGFDDIDLAAGVSPPLTTMHVDRVGMGRLAVQLLADRVQFPESEKITILLRPRLVERETVAKLS